MMRTEYETRGEAIRACAKSLVLDFMRDTEICQPGKEGMRLATIAEKCGLKDDAKRSWWVTALVRELKEDGKVERVAKRGSWWRLMTLRAD